MTEPQRTLPTSPSLVPAAPFRNLVGQWIEKNACSWMQAGNKAQYQQSPNEIAAAALFPDNERMGAKRNLYALLHERQEIHFDLADRIVCKLLGDPGLWSSDPELSEIMDNVNLRAVDAAKPTCEKAQQHIFTLVRKTYAKTKSSNATAKKLGLSLTFVNYVVTGIAERGVAA